jgi:murein DD-endopeptidase MepM/ murein hydrolase activator NlpD
LTLGACVSDTTTGPRGTPPSTSTPDPAVCAQPFGDPTTALYVLPYPVGREYRLNQGACPSNPSFSHHRTIAYDFGLSIGDPVVASRAGVVNNIIENWPDSDRDCLHNNFLTVLHEDSTMMMYLHLKQDGVLVELGDTVAQGQFIAQSGDSGCTTGPHLHMHLFRPPAIGGQGGTLPFNFRNAEGPLSPDHRLSGGAWYRALALPKGITPG